MLTKSCSSPESMISIEYLSPSISASRRYNSIFFFFFLKSLNKIVRTQEKEKGKGKGKGKVKSEK